jgi:hypothetical protein
MIQSAKLSYLLVITTILGTACAKKEPPIKWFEYNFVKAQKYEPSSKPFLTINKVTILSPNKDCNYKYCYRLYPVKNGWYCIFDASKSIMYHFDSAGNQISTIDAPNTSNGMSVYNKIATFPNCDVMCLANFNRIWTLDDLGFWQPMMALKEGAYSIFFDSTDHVWGYSGYTVKGEDSCSYRLQKYSANGQVISRMLRQNFDYNSGCDDNIMPYYSNLFAESYNDTIYKLYPSGPKPEFVFNFGGLSVSRADLIQNDIQNYIRSTKYAKISRIIDNDALLIATIVVINPNKLYEFFIALIDKKTGQSTIYCIDSYKEHQLGLAYTMCFLVGGGGRVGFLIDSSRFDEFLEIMGMVYKEEDREEIGPISKPMIVECSISNVYDN